jgi:hypothetical protein
MLALQMSYKNDDGWVCTHITWCIYAFFHSISFKLLCGIALHFSFSFPPAKKELKTIAYTQMANCGEEETQNHGMVCIVYYCVGFI